MTKNLLVRNLENSKIKNTDNMFKINQSQVAYNSMATPTMTSLLSPRKLSKVKTTNQEKTKVRNNHVSLSQFCFC